MTGFDKTRLPHTTNSSTLITYNLASCHAIDLEFSQDFVIKQQVKIETDGILLLRVTNLQTYNYIQIDVCESLVFSHLVTFVNELSLVTGKY